MLTHLVACLGFSKKIALLAVCLVICLVLAPRILSYAASDNQTNSISITAEVLPARYIVVNSKNEIIEVITNTRQLVTPSVLLNSISGSQQIYTNYIAVQYQRLLTTCNFQKNSGIIYHSGNCTDSLSVAKTKSKSSFVDIISILRISRLDLII